MLFFLVPSSSQWRVAVGMCDLHYLNYRCHDHAGVAWQLGRGTRGTRHDVHNQIF